MIVKLFGKLVLVKGPFDIAVIKDVVSNDKQFPKEISTEYEKSMVANDNYNTIGNFIRLE